MIIAITIILYDTCIIYDIISITFSQCFSFSKYIEALYVCKLFLCIFIYVDYIKIPNNISLISICMSINVAFDEYATGFVILM